MQPLYIFDLDGTLADIEHRRHLIQKTVCPACGGIVMIHPKPTPERICRACSETGCKKPDWTAFYRECVHDEPKWPVISTMIMLARQGADVWIWSGRSAEVMNETRTWLQTYVPSDELEGIEICMRREGDYTPDEELKAGWYEQLNQYDKERLVAIFDDRQKVVDMWRSKGITCFQVAPGDF